MVKVLTKIRYHVKSGFRHGFKNVIFSKFFFGFVASIGVLLSSHDKTGRIKDNLRARLHDQEDTFDFVIVGAGTAGSLLANRLSEQHKVLVLEAGGEPHPLQRIPALAFFMLNYRETDWMHRTVPQRRACFSSPGRRAGWCQGRNLGGTSNLNWMVHMRGSPRDYDNWAKITNDESWSYEALLHYFRKHENYQGDSPDREAHGFDGDMMFEGPSYTGMAKEFIRAGQELGYEHVDLNARFEEGFDSIYSPMEMGERKASYHAFLEPVRDRETLTIRKYSRVTKILIRSFDNTAFGVEYNRHGVQKSAYATKEVILCAGTVESPKLLMLSGIGPKTHLADLGIPVVADLPVGKNLQDHLAVVLGPFFVDPPRSYLIERDITLKSFYEYKSDGNGPLSSSLFQAAAMISSKNSKHMGTWNWPDILLLLSGMAGHKTFARDMAHAFNLNQKIIKKYYHHASGRDSFMVFVSASRPEGRGDVTLEKRDADAPPSINPHYLENESDMQITIEGIKTALYLVENTTSFQNLRARFTNKKFPGCDHMPFRSDTYWECYTRHFSVSLNDGAGSCAMGNPDLNLFAEGNGWGKSLPGSGFVGAVVDPKLQVIGINHLRVADASVMPQIVGSQPMAAVLMIAEKCADMINDAWNGNGDGPPMTTYKPYGWGEHMSEQGKQPTSPQYGPPTPQEYGPPPGPPPAPQYGTPQQSVVAEAEMPPLQQQYGPPGSPEYGPPAVSYGSPSMTTVPMEGGYSSPSESPPGMAMSNFGESQQMSDIDEATMMTTTPEAETTTMTTTSTTTKKTMEPMVSYGPPQTDSDAETTTLRPSESYGVPGLFESSNQLYNGWSGGGIMDQQYGPPGQQYGAPPPTNDIFGGPHNEIPSSSTQSTTGVNNGNSPPPYLVPPGLPGEDSTTMASSTTSMEISPPPGDRAEPPYQPQLGNPLFGGGDPRNIPPPGDSDMSSTTISSGGNGLDPPEENAPSGARFDPIFADQATSESSLGKSTYKSFFSSTDSPGISGSGSTAAARPDVGFLEHDTKLRPGVQISNPFPDIYYATQDSNDVPESFFKKYPISSSVEFGNKIPSPPNISGLGASAGNGPLFFRNPEYTTRHPIVFGNLLKMEKASQRVDMPHPYHQHFNKSAVAVSRQAPTSDSTPYIPYYNDKNRRPDEGTVKPTILYKSVGATNKIPSTANVPNIYYSVKDKVSKEGNLADDPGIPVMYVPIEPSPPLTSPSSTPTSMLSGFGGSAASSSNKYWTNASPGPILEKEGDNGGMENAVKVEIAEKGHISEGRDGYWTNASPKPIPLPRHIENAIPVESEWKQPVRFSARRRKPSVDTEEDKRRIVRIKSEMIWTTTQRPTIKQSFLTTSFPPASQPNDEGPPEVGTKMRIRVKTKQSLLKGEMEEPEAVVSPYWTQANRTKIITSTTTQKPGFSISGTSSPTEVAYYHESASDSLTVTPRPLLSTQLWPGSDRENKNEASSNASEDETAAFLSHPGFGIGDNPAWQQAHSSVETVGVGSVHPVDDQESSHSILSNFVKGLGGRRKMPPRAPIHGSHYDRTAIRSIPYQSAQPSVSNYVSSEYSTNQLMLTQVPDLFVQDKIVQDRGQREGEYGDRKTSFVRDASHYVSREYSNRYHPNEGQHAQEHIHGNGNHNNFEVFNHPHQFDSGERNRFNFFSGTGNAGGTGEYHHQGQQTQYDPPSSNSHLPPPLNQNFRVTTPATDLSASSAYDENPLQYFNDATAKIPERFQLRPATIEQGRGPPHDDHLINHYKYINNENVAHPPAPIAPSPSVPQFVENSGELGSHLGGDSRGVFDENQNAIAGRFPPNSLQPFPQTPNSVTNYSPVRPPPSAFSLGHSSPVGMGGGSSLPPAKGFNSEADDIHATHQPPSIPHFEPPLGFRPGFTGLPNSESHLSAAHEDLGQIPDIFGFRNVLPSTSAPFTAVNTGDTGGGGKYHPQKEENFNVAQLDFSSPPTTALQQSIHNILIGSPSSTPVPHGSHSIGLPPPRGSLELPQYLGESGPKAYEDGVDPNKISLTYDDTGANGFLDPPVIMGDGEVKNNPVDIDQISLTGNNAVPPQQFLQHKHPHDYRSSHQQEISPQFQNTALPLVPGGAAPFSEESRKEDVTQTREQILSNFGPQNDPEDFNDGGRQKQPSSSTRFPTPSTPLGITPHQHTHSTTPRPFGGRLKGKERNPFQDTNFFDDNPLAHLLLTQEERNQNGGLRHHHSQPSSNFGNGGSTPQPGIFSVTPFEQPDFTRFDVGGPTASSLEPNNFDSTGIGHLSPVTSTVVPPPHLIQKPKMKEYTIYSNPDDVDITVDHTVTAFPNVDDGRKTDHLRRRADGDPQKRRKRRRGHHKLRRQVQSSTRRGGRAIRLRHLWGGEGGTPQKRRRRYYKLRRNSGGGNRTISSSALVPTSMEEPTSSKPTLQTKDKDDMEALSQELLSSFLGFGFGTGGPENEAVLRQLLRNATVSSREEDRREVGENLSISMEEDMGITSTPSSVETISTETEASFPFANEWTSFEAATTNATMLV